MISEGPFGRVRCVLFLEGREEGKETRPVSDHYDLGVVGGLWGSASGLLGSLRLSLKDLDVSFGLTSTEKTCRTIHSFFFLRKH